MTRITTSPRATALRASIGGPENGRVLASGLVTPPNNIGERTTPNYEAALAQPAVYPLPNGGRVFAGQRDEGFYIDVGGVFDTLKLKSIGALGGSIRLPASTLTP